MPPRRDRMNGVKTAALLGAGVGLALLVLLVGVAFAAAFGNATIIWVFALLGVRMTVYGHGSPTRQPSARCAHSP